MGRSRFFVRSIFSCHDADSVCASGHADFKEQVEDGRGKLALYITRSTATRSRRMAKYSKSPKDKHWPARNEAHDFVFRILIVGWCRCTQTIGMWPPWIMLKVGMW